MSENQMTLTDIKKIIRHFSAVDSKGIFFYRQFAWYKHPNLLEITFAVSSNHWMLKFGDSTDDEICNHSHDIPWLLFNSLLFFLGGGGRGVIRIHLKKRPSVIWKLFRGEFLTDVEPKLTTRKPEFMINIIIHCPSSVNVNTRTCIEYIWQTTTDVYDSIWLRYNQTF